MRAKNALLLALVFLLFLNAKAQVLGVTTEAAEDTMTFVVKLEADYGQNPFGPSPVVREGVGSIIGYKWVLTAKHIFENYYQYNRDGDVAVLMRLRFLDIIAGAKNLNFDDAQQRRVENNFLDINLNPSFRLHQHLDLALVRVDFDESPHVSAAKLSSDYDLRLNNLRCVVQGWGKSRILFDDRGGQVYGYHRNINQARQGSLYFFEEQNNEHNLLEYGCPDLQRDCANPAPGDSGAPLLCASKWQDPLVHGRVLAVHVQGFEIEERCTREGINYGVDVRGVRAWIRFQTDLDYNQFQ